MNVAFDILNPGSSRHNKNQSNTDDNYAASRAKSGTAPEESATNATSEQTNDPVEKSDLPVSQRPDNATFETFLTDIKAKDETPVFPHIFEDKVEIPTFPRIADERVDVAESATPLRTVANVTDIFIRDNIDISDISDDGQNIDLPALIDLPDTAIELVIPATTPATDNPAVNRSAVDIPALPLDARIAPPETVSDIIPTKPLDITGGPTTEKGEKIPEPFLTANASEEELTGSVSIRNAEQAYPAADDLTSLLDTRNADKALFNKVSVTDLSKVSVELPQTFSAALTTSGPTDKIVQVQPALNLTAVPPQAHPALQQVAEILIRAQQTQNGISIRLDPPELGNVSIQFHIDSERNVTAVVRAEMAETSSILRDKSEILLQALKDNGFENIDLSFEQGTGFDQDQSDPENTMREFNVTAGDNSALEAIISSEHKSTYPQYAGGSRVDMKL